MVGAAYVDRVLIAVIYTRALPGIAFDIPSLLFKQTARLPETTSPGLPHQSPSFERSLFRGRPGNPADKQIPSEFLQPTEPR